ncbi:hypothetical protein CHELA20_11096 [Hyphomicrobiales bacterium]|nr:hypothetical protein CHELA20_11096 [Hyphomicrobiales bacterium]
MPEHPANGSASAVGGNHIAGMERVGAGLRLQFQPDAVRFLREIDQRRAPSNVCKRLVGQAVEKDLLHPALLQRQKQRMFLVGSMLVDHLLHKTIAEIDKVAFTRQGFGAEFAAKTKAIEELRATPLDSKRATAVGNGISGFQDDGLHAAPGQ